MKIIEASYIIHRNHKRIRLEFEDDETINQLVRKINHSKFSRTLKSWHIPCDKPIYVHFKRSLPRGWRIEERATDERFQEPENNIAEYSEHPPASLNIKQEIPALNPENQAALRSFVTQLELKSYSESTIRTYRNEFSAFLSVLNSREAQSISAEELKRYMHYCAIVLRLGENTLHSRLNALKFYYEQVLRKDKFFFDIPRPKKPFQLPKVLGEKEIGKLFNALTNKKHKAILFTAYSGGLRVSEAVSLKLKDIDSDRMQIFIEQAKGKKDRYVMLSPVLLDILRNYLKGCKPKPVKYLFEGDIPGEPMSTRSAQHIFLEAKIKAGLQKQLSFHSLRHSFATHLLENGVDIKYIKDLLGHFSIRTTTRYLHVRRENLVDIRSPFDDIFRSGNIEF